MSLDSSIVGLRPFTLNYGYFSFFESRVNRRRIFIRVPFDDSSAGLSPQRIISMAVVSVSGDTPMDTSDLELETVTRGGEWGEEAFRDAGKATFGDL